MATQCKTGWMFCNSHLLMPDADLLGLALRPRSTAGSPGICFCPAKEGGGALKDGSRRAARRSRTGLRGSIRARFAEVDRC